MAAMFEEDGLSKRQRRHYFAFLLIVFLRSNLKVEKRKNFYGSDLEFFTFSLLNA